MKRLKELWNIFARDMVMVQMTHDGKFSEEIKGEMERRGWSLKESKEEVYTSNIALPPLWLSFTRSVFIHKDGANQGDKLWYDDLSNCLFQSEHHSGFLTKVI